MSVSPTPYDDVYKTLCDACPQLLLPLLNETFGTSYNGHEKIQFDVTEQRFTDANGVQKKRISDSIFTVVSENNLRRYLYECESNPDGSILIRFFEYAVLSGLKHHTFSDYQLTIPFPHVAVLALRSPASMPNQMRVCLQLPNDTSAEVDIPVLKLQDYTIDELFEKKLYILLPFSLFLFEKDFDTIEIDKQQLQRMCEQFSHFRERLESLPDEPFLTDYRELYIDIILSMTRNVIISLAHNHQHIQEGVKNAMGGNIIEIPALTAYRNGKQEGLQQNAQALNEATQRADNATQRADAAETRVAELEAILREHHIEV